MHAATSSVMNGVAMQTDRSADRTPATRGDRLEPVSDPGWLRGRLSGDVS